MKDKNGNAFYPCPYYPVGSIYISLSNINPSEFFGGTWTKLESRFLIGSGNATGEGGEHYSFIPNATGGEYSHKLTINEMPSHYHRNPLGIPDDRNFSGGSDQLVAADSNDASGNNSYATDSRGGDRYHNNLPPFLVVNMWSRTA